MGTQDMVSQLAKVPLFSGCSRRELQLISKAGKRTTRRAGTGGPARNVKLGTAYRTPRSSSSVSAACDGPPFSFWKPTGHRQRMYRPGP